MDAPEHLSHKPIIAVNNYNKIDAHFTYDYTDAMALSIGQACYSVDEISLKVWRHNDEKWSRQSEELPVSRNLDLTILFLGGLLAESGVNFPNTNLGESVVDMDNLLKIKKYYEDHEKYLKPRLIEIQKKLEEFLK